MSVSVRRTMSAALAAILLAAAQHPAAAHVMLDVQAAPVGSTYKAIIRVPHGCAGAATIVLRAQIPEGLIAVKPSPKPGWSLEIVKGDYKGTHDYYGTPASKGVIEVVWSGGQLLDEWYDEFVFRGYLSKSLAADTTLYLPVVQECEGGRAERWIEIPGAGKKAEDYRFPAPGLQLKAPAAPGSAHR